MRQALMVVNGRAATEHLMLLALRWRETGYANSIFWLAHRDDANHAPIVTDHGFEAAGPGAQRLLSVPSPGEAQASVQVQTEKSSDRARPPERGTFGEVLRMAARSVRVAHRIRSERRKNRHFLSSRAIDVIVTSQERPIEFLPMLASARDLGVPIMLVPSNFLCQPDGGAFMRRTDARLMLNLSFRRAREAKCAAIWIVNKLIARFLPRQILASRHGDMLCYPGDYLLTLWMGGVLPVNLWHQGTRFVDRMIISGDEEIAVCEAAGMPAAHVAKLGSPILEVLLRTRSKRDLLRRQFADDLGIDPARKIMIFAMPVMWEHKMLPREDQFAMLEDVLPILRKYDGSVLLSLHPKSQKRDYIEIARRHGMVLLDQSLMDVLVSADAFVGCAYSSTIRWALALNLPTANLDFWQLNESTYADYPDYPTLRSAGDLDRWVADASMSGYASGDPRNPARSSLGIVMDGKFSEHMQLLSEQLIAERSSVSI